MGRAAPGPGGRATDIQPRDITAIFCLRAHAENPWVLDRLHLIADHYDPLPSVLVCDFGSSPEYAARIASTCALHGFQYVRVDDEDLYSPGAARNRAFEAANTDLAFFSDMDTFGRRSLFQELADAATAAGMKETTDVVLTLPVFHLSECDTARCLGAASALERSRRLDSNAFAYLYREQNHAEGTFVVPYSNIFLIRKDFFSIAGGYDERFRGHGSEDFELLTRLALYSSHLPRPTDLTEDKYSPLHASFYASKPYSGFRRLLEAMAFPAEVFGLRVHHLWHPRDTSSAWLGRNDWKRERLNEAFKAYLSDQRRVLDVDFLGREKQALCIYQEPDSWRDFLPLRLAGYRIFAVDTASASLASALDLARSGQADCLAVGAGGCTDTHRALLAEAELHQVPVVPADGGQIKWQRDATPFAKRSYISARIDMSSLWPKPHLKWGLAKRAVHRVCMALYAPFQTVQNRQRFKTDPVPYLQKAKAAHNRLLGRILLDPSQRPY